MFALTGVTLSWLLWTGQNFFGILGIFVTVWTLILALAYLPARRRFESQSIAAREAHNKTILDLERRRQELAGEIAALADKRAEARFEELLDECRWLAERGDQLAKSLKKAGIEVPEAERPRPVQLRTRGILREADIDPDL